MNADEISKSATRWTKHYGLVKVEIVQKDIEELFNKYSMSDEDIGRLTAGISVATAKDIVKRGGRNGWR